jgi:hypothetical protein
MALDQRRDVGVVCSGEKVSFPAAMTRISANASMTRIEAGCDSNDGSLTDCSNVGASTAAGIVEASGSMDLCPCMVSNTHYWKKHLYGLATLAKKNDRDGMASVVHDSNCLCKRMYLTVPPGTPASLNQSRGLR